MALCRRVLVLLLLALMAALARPAAADDVGVTSARLIELADGDYAVEADVSPVLVAALRPPVVPDRFTLLKRPSYRRVGVGLVVRYEFGGSDIPLQAGDVLLLPWARSAVLLTARWRDGEVQRAMFPRGPAGIRVPIEVLKPVQRSALAVASDHFRLGFGRDTSTFLRLLLVLGFVTAAAATGWRAVRLALIFAAGHALSMVALDLGMPDLPDVLAQGGLGIGVVLLARSGLRRDVRPLWPLVLLLGLVDGLGLGASLKEVGLAPDQVVPALFGVIIGIAVAQVTATAVVALLWRAIRQRQVATGLTAALGSVAVAVTLATTVSGLRAADGLGIDPADRMAAARFDFKSGGGVGGGGTGARAPAPRRLDESAMVFLTVEPVEVRLEVLLSLRDFMGPLRIEGGPGSIVPVDVQGAIAARAREMVAGAVGVAIDGREAVPILQRTDFVTVAATGVATRQQSEPEQLDSSVLGVTLVFGVERPPSEIELGWRVFPTSGMVVPAVWTDPTGSERVALTHDQRTLRWANDLSSYATPPVKAVEVQPVQWPLVSVIMLLLAAVIWFGSLRYQRWRLAVWLMVAVAVALYPFVRSAVALPGIGGWSPVRAEMGEVLDGVLTNIYRSFDLRDEEAIYDRLAVSVTGGQLSEVYLENRRALELEDRGGARARVDEVEVLEVRSVRRDGQGGFRVETRWVVSGSVNHFGHVHYRQNRYDAAIHLIAIEGIWKIREIEVLDERRVL